MGSGKILSEGSSLLERIVPQETLDKLQDFIESLEQPIGTDAFTLPGEDRLDLKTEGSLQIFDQPLSASGNLSGHAAFLGATAAADPFSIGESRPLREPENGNTFNSGRLDLRAGFGLDTQIPLVSGAGGGVQLSAKAGASGAFHYRHYIAANASWSRARAFRELILDSHLPQFLDLRTPPEIGEVHRLDAKLQLDFGLDFKAGYDAATEISLEISDGLSLPFKTSFAATIHAALGLGLYEEMSLAVGRAHQLEDGWVRIRLQRRSERKFSFGVTVGLDLHYDLGTGLAQLFEDALDQVPTRRLVDAAREIARYADVDTLKAEAQGEIADVLEELVGEKIVDELDEVIPFARRVVDTWDGLDERVQSLWERVLSRADLGAGSKARQWLQKLEELKNGVNVDDLVKNDDLRDLVEAIEAISGQSLEELLLDETGIQGALDEVSKTATEALGFLDDGATADVAKKIQEFAEKTGISKVVDVLRDLDSKEAIASEVSGRIQKLAGRIAGKAVSLFKKEDLDKIKAWANKVAGLLDPDDPTGEAEKLKQRIAAQIEKLKLDYGFSVSLEIDRVSRQTALFDLELSHQQDAAGLRRKVGEALRLGQAQKVLEVLAEESRMVEKPSATNAVDTGGGVPAARFLLRECVFTSERIRTSAVSVMLNIVGLGRLFGGKERGFNRRLEQSTVRVVDRKLHDAPEIDAQDPKRFERQGHWAAGYSRGERTRDLDTETTIWLVSDDKGFGLDGAYDHDRERSLRLAFSWEDDASNIQELEALYRLLDQLGFSAAATTASGSALPATADALLDRGQAVRFAFEIRFPDTAVGKVLDSVSDDTLWRRAFLNACYRWLSEAFVTRPRVAGPAQNTHNLGQVMARILAYSPDIRKQLVDSDFFSDLGGESLRVSFENGENVRFPVGRLDDPEPLTGILHSIVAHNQRGASALGRLGKAWDAATTSRTPAAYADLSAKFSDGWRAASIATLRWPNSMFAVWLYLALLNLAAPDQLAKATGVATLRWREGGAAGDEDPSWSEPMFWRLADGVPPSLGRLDVFPIP